MQIGNAITEKMVLDVLLQARDRGLFHAVTDCGAGGFSSAVGEMGEDLGAEVWLEKAPLKYEGLTYTEIWISEAQERMVFAVPQDSWDELRELCESEGVEAAVLGSFRPHRSIATDLPWPCGRRRVDAVPSRWPSASDSRCGLRARAESRHVGARDGRGLAARRVAGRLGKLECRQQALGDSPV